MGRTFGFSKEGRIEHVDGTATKASAGNIVEINAMSITQHDSSATAPGLSVTGPALVPDSFKP